MHVKGFPAAKGCAEHGALSIGLYPLPLGHNHKALPSLMISEVVIAIRTLPFIPPTLKHKSTRKAILWIHSHIGGINVDTCTVCKQSGTSAFYLTAHEQQAQGHTGAKTLCLGLQRDIFKWNQIKILSISIRKVKVVSKQKVKCFLLNLIIVALSLGYSEKGLHKRNVGVTKMGESFHKAVDDGSCGYGNTKYGDHMQSCSGNPGKTPVDYTNQDTCVNHYWPDSVWRCKDKWGDCSCGPR